MMNRMVKSIISTWQIATICLMLNCGRHIELEGFDRKLWVEDQNGCNGFRISQHQIIQENQDVLLGLTSRQILRLLGKPDRNELFPRNQKFYIYIMEPGPDCVVFHDNKLPETLFIRFSAMGITQEVFLKKGSSPI